MIDRLQRIARLSAGTIFHFAKHITVSVFCNNINLAASEKIVEENHLTTLMITHNMKDAIKYGNRLIMMYEGHVIYDVKGEEKKNLQVSDLLQRFEQVSDGEFANDRMLLS